MEALIVEQLALYVKFLAVIALQNQSALHANLDILVILLQLLIVLAAIKHVQLAHRYLPA